MLAPPRFRVRAAAPTDLNVLVDLEHRIFTAPWSADALAAELVLDPSRIALVCEQNDAIVGYAFAWLVADEIHLVSLAVAPHCRRRGMGQALLSTVLRSPLTRAARMVTLEVRAGNEAAQTLYRRNGFVEVAIRRGYYPDNREDAIIMIKHLRRPVAPDAGG